MKTILIFLSLFCFACSGSRSDSSDDNDSSSIVFDREKWRLMKDGDYVYRDKMLEDLFKKKTIRQMNEQQVRAFLGPPDRSDTGYLFYRITQTRIKLFPLHTKTLVIKFYRDSTVEWTKIHE